MQHLKFALRKKQKCACCQHFLAFIHTLEKINFLSYKSRYIVKYLLFLQENTTKNGVFTVFETNKNIQHYVLILSQYYDCVFDRPSIIYLTNICLDTPKTSDISIPCLQAFLCLTLLNFLALSTVFFLKKLFSFIFYFM